MADSTHENPTPPTPACVAPLLDPSPDPPEPSHPNGSEPTSAAEASDDDAQISLESHVITPTDVDLLSSPSLPPTTAPDATVSATDEPAGVAPPSASEDTVSEPTSTLAAPEKEVFFRLPSQSATTDLASDDSAVDDDDSTDRSESSAVGDATAQETPNSGVRQRRSARNQAKPEAPKASAARSAKEQLPVGRRGRTKSGSGFVVPETHDVLHSIMHPHTWNIFDYLHLSIFALHLYLFVWVRPSPFLFLCLFFFWRCAYDIGIGFLLRAQSETQWSTRAMEWFMRTQSNTRLYKLMRTALSRKLDPSFDFDSAPPAFNAWLAFRQLVDIVLGQDLSTYALFCLSYMEFPTTSLGLFDVLQYCAGVFLCVLNLWIKKDALRVVKVEAWYWSDFWFTIDAQLTFDGVYQMAPHPMYSVGYMFKYGCSLAMRSYVVLYASIAAHIMQFAFLYVVENPHIEKIYGKPTKPAVDADQAKALRKYFRGSTFFGLSQLDPLRASDLLLMIVLALLSLSVFLPLSARFFFLMAVAFRLLHSGGLGLLLFHQSNSQWFTRHWVLRGFTKAYAFDQFRTLFTASLLCTHLSFVVCTLSLYHLPDDWAVGGTLFRHVLGAVLVALHVLASLESYEVLGDFGWFYGDFFLPDVKSNINYTGIYRFLNNPEKYMGFAGHYGLAIISGNLWMYFLALLSQVSWALFLQYVEQPHTERIYGEQYRRESGATQAIKDKVRPVIDTLLEPLRKRIEAAPLKNDLDSLRVAVRERVQLLRAEIDSIQTRAKALARERLPLLNENNSRRERQTALAALLNQLSPAHMVPLGRELSLDETQAILAELWVLALGPSFSLPASSLSPDDEFADLGTSTDEEEQLLALIAAAFGVSLEKRFCAERQTLQQQSRAIIEARECLT